MRLETVAVTAFALLMLASCKPGPEAKQAASSTAGVLQRGAPEPFNPVKMQVGVHEVIAFDIKTPVADSLVDVRSCLVWRDTEFKTATMTCEPNRMDVK